MGFMWYEWYKIDGLHRYLFLLYHLLYNVELMGSIAICQKFYVFVISPPVNGIRTLLSSTAIEKIIDRNVKFVFTLKRRMAMLLQLYNGWVRQ